jgi:hypothetical protein
MKTLYKFLRTGLKSEHGNHTWEIGKWYEVQGEVVPCYNGFHGSVEPLDALHYVKGEILAIVEVDGYHVSENDKQAWQKMRIVDARVWDKRDSVALAVFCAQMVLAIFESRYPQDKRPRKAIEAAAKWISSDKNHADTDADTDAYTAAYADAAAAAAAAAYTDAAAFGCIAGAGAAADAAYAAADAAAAAAAAAYTDADAAAAAYAAAAARAAAAADAAAAAVPEINNWIKDQFQTLQKI